jgi:arsenite methyltransferase
MSDDLKDRVRKKYAELAVASQEGGDASCCGSSCGCDTGDAAAATSVIVDLAHRSYSEAEKGELPQAAVGASLGCGNPTTLATLSPGEVVLERVSKLPHWQLAWNRRTLVSVSVGEVDRSASAT